MEFLSCGLLIATHFSALSGGEELKEQWGEQKEGGAEERTVVGEHEQEGEGVALGKRRSSEV